MNLLWLLGLALFSDEPDLREERQALGLDDEDKEDDEFLGTLHSGEKR